MNNYQVSFRNGPTIIVQASGYEMARIQATAQTKRQYSDIVSVTQTSGAY